MTDSISQLYEVRLRYVRRKLQEHKFRWPQVADGSGVSLRTLSKVARSEIKTPRNDIVDSLWTFFVDQDRMAS